MELRPETTRDIDAIRELTRVAFAPMPYSDGTEPDVIDRLRNADALTLSLVAEIDGEVVGQVTFSPANGSADWYALGPVSVQPERQSEGIGRAMIRAGLEQLRTAGATGCMLVGNPAYYSRFGFELTPALCPQDEPAEFFQTLRLGDGATDTLAFHAAFYGDL